MTDNGAKALAERIHEVILSADYDAEDEAELILANGAVFLTAEEAERQRERRIEAALDVERLAREAFDKTMEHVEPWASGPVSAKHGALFVRNLRAALHPADPSRTP